MISQSARHIMMMEPVGFHSNPETKETNTYQADDDSDTLNINTRAVAEFRTLRDRLVEAGIIVTTVIGQRASPDDIFCNNWVSTHGDGSMVLYPMLAPNRRIERRPELLDMLSGRYRTALDLSAEEKVGRFLESTGSLGLDRVNKIVYVAVSPRTDKELVNQWAHVMGFEVVFFNTRNHAGKPVYHTDVCMFIGTSLIGICADCIVPEDRERVLSKIRETHAVLLLTMDQLRSFCGNALELRGTHDHRYLAMSARAHDALDNDQRALIAKHFEGGIISSAIPTIETYGGGSVRCMLLELH